MNTIRTLAAAAVVAAALVGGTLLVVANADDIAADPGVVGSLSATTVRNPADRVVVVTQPQSVTTDALDPTTGGPGVAGLSDDDHDDDQGDDHDDDDRDDDHDDGEHEEEDEFEGHDDDD